MKKHHMVFCVSILFLLLTSRCTEKEIVTSQFSKLISSADFLSSTSTTSPTALQLSRDPDFIALNSTSMQILRYASTANVNAMTKGYLTPAELQELALDLHFDDSTALINTLHSQTTLGAKLRNRYPNLTNAAIAGACNILNPTLPQPCSTCFVTPCYDQFILCSKTANNDYTIGVIRCTVEAITLGMVFGVGGVVYQLGCGALEIRKLNLARQQCSLSYRNCS